jgi:UDP-2,3-diacylglucosamine pyrophosphatase LpxH
MNTYNQLSRLSKEAKEIVFDDNSKIVIMSDCHRGYEIKNDDFLKNKNIFGAALKYYYDNLYTYIELGDGDELWEYKSYKEIINSNKDIFELLANFYKNKNFYMLYGNHDLIKKDKIFRKKYMSNYYDNNKKEEVPLFPNIDVLEAIILKQKDTNNKFLLTHGHQGDFLNDGMWKTARFLVRHIWGPLEGIGISNPMRVANNNKKKGNLERVYINWSIDNKQGIMTGHIHRASFPKINEAIYFNSGCCVRYGYITAIEIVNGYIMLVKWSIKTRDDRSLFIDKEILNGPIKIDRYFSK